MHPAVQDGPGSIATKPFREASNSTYWVFLVPCLERVPSHDNNDSTEESFGP
jgi:hypothetical protein